MFGFFFAGEERAILIQPPPHSNAQRSHPICRPSSYTSAYVTESERERDSVRMYHEEGVYDVKRDARAMTSGFAICASNTPPPSVSSFAPDAV